MGSIEIPSNAPCWPATRRNVLAYCREARATLRFCDRRHRTTYCFALRQAQRWLAGMRKERA